MRDDAIRQFERGIRRVIRRTGIGFAGLVPALGNVRGAEAGNGLHVAEQVVEDVPPVAQHIEDHPAAVFLAVVPGRTLGRDEIALEDPVAELAAYGKDLSEKAGITQGL